MKSSAGSLVDLDVRELPSYGISEAAHYLRIPVTTVRSWIVGRKYPTHEGPRFFEPVIEIPEHTVRLLSFVNLIEIPVLDALRRDHSTFAQG